MTNLQDSYSGMLAGTALGDAWGAETEFMSHDDILRAHPGGVAFPTRGLVTDDTQMAYALADALTPFYSLDLAHISGPRIRTRITNAFLSWFDDPRNTPSRAPGNSCMSAMRQLRDKAGTQVHLGNVDTVALTGSTPDAKGCGTVMRAAPCGYLPLGERAQVAAFQAALTHAHPVAVTSSILVADLVATLHDPASLDVDVFDIARHCIATNRVLLANTSWDEWLGDIPTREGFADAHAYLNAGWDELDTYLTRVRDSGWDNHGDVCLYAGQGWVAEESVGCALLLAQSVFTNKLTPLGALALGAASNGDSDSIACIAGAFIGAKLGADAFIDMMRHVESFYAHTWRSLILKFPSPDIV